MKQTRRPTAALAVVALALVMLWGTAAAAQPRPNVYDGGNRWEITYFNDPTADHDEWATQVICFLPYAVVGTSIQGAWYALTFPDWNGRYYQEGDEVKMTGSWAEDRGHDHMTLFHTTWNRPREVHGMAFKDWTEWWEDGKFGNVFAWGNTRLTRTGRCGIAGGPEGAELEERALALSREVPPRLLRDGKTRAEAPGQEGQESLDSYFERTGQKYESRGGERSGG